LKEKELIIIGSGPAGLRAALEAQKMGIDYLVLEQGDVAQAWLDVRPDMFMLSPCHPQRDWTSISNEFPIWKLPVARPYCTAKEFVDYLQAFCDHFKIHLKTNTTVQKIEQCNGLFILNTNSERYQAQAIYVATGFFGNPYIPDIPGLRTSTIVSHSHYYQTPEPFRHKRVVIIGAGNSGAEIAIALSGYAQVFLITRGKLKFFSKTKNLCHIRGISESMLLELIQMDLIKHISGVGIKKLENNLLYLENQSIETQSIICATGYRPVLDILENFQLAVDKKSKFPEINSAGQARGIRNLFFGGPLAYTGSRSLFIHGFIRSIPAVVRQIKNRLHDKESINTS
jgi:thioredoxin reductase